MTWTNRVAVRILLLVARMFADNEWREEIKQLANHIEYNAGREEKKA